MDTSRTEEKIKNGMIPAVIGPDPRNAKAQLNLAKEPSMAADNGVLFDFNFGFRVQMPPENKTYILHVWNADTQAIIANMEVPGGAMAVGDRKYFIRFYFEVSEKDTGKLIASHTYNCEEKPVMIVIPDGGLGDCFAWMPYAEEFRKKYRAKVTCVCGEWLTRLIRDQYPELEFASAADIPDSKDYYATYCCAIFPKERKMWRPSDHQNFGMQGSIARLLGVDPVPCKVRLPHCPDRPVKEPYVCISTLATNPAKYWNFPDGWNILCRHLKRLGYRVFVIDRDRSLKFNNVVYSIPEEAEDCTGLKPIAERMAMLQHAEFFIGLPSGLSWLAWNCNIPVVMISGFTMDGSEFPTPYRVFNPDFCHGCWNDSNLFFDAKAPVWCPRQLGTPREIECTRTITPKMVIDAVNRIPAVCTKIRPLVTFALPVHNPAPELFADMLQSVIDRAKAYGNAEILILDDGSRASAAKVLIKEYQRKNPGLIFAELLKKSEGKEAALQGLLERARGRYFIPVDQNALMLPFDLHRIIGKMEEAPEIVCNDAPKWFFNGDGPIKGAKEVVQDSAVFRTESLRKCGAWKTPGCRLFDTLASCGKTEHDPEVRTLALLQNSESAAVGKSSVPGAVIDAWNNILAPKKELFAAAVNPIRISVIIPVFRGRYIAECVHSVVQTFAPYGQTEILLFNDASPEPELDVRLQVLQAENPDMIRIFRGKTNLGVALARQEMLKHVKGDYIVSFDHDDIMLPFNVKKVVDFMDANPQYCASYAPKYLFNENGYMNEIHGSEFSLLQCLFAPKVNINAIFLRKTDLIDAGGFMEACGDKTLGMDDLYLYVRLFLKKDVYFDPEARTLFRIHPSQITSKTAPWDDWLTQQPCDQHPELVKRILAGDIPDPCGPDFRIVRGLMGAMIFFHQHEPQITEPIILAAMKYFPEDPGVPDARLRLFRMQNRMEELLAYYPQVLEQFKDTLLPRINILYHVLSAMQGAKMPLPPELVQMYEELRRKYFRLSPLAEAAFRQMKMQNRAFPSVPELFNGTQPVISIGVPVFNPPKELFPFVLRSLVDFAKRYPAVEILLHDDASTDPEIVPILKEWQQKYPQWIKLQLSAENQGIAKARQAMVENAVGRYFLSSDSDDLLLLFDAEKEIAFLDKHPDVAATYSRRILFNPENLKFQPPTASPCSDFLGLCMMTQSTNGALIRMSALRACEGYTGFDDVEDDIVLYAKLVMQGKTILRNEPRVLVSVHPPREHLRGTQESYTNLTAKMLESYAKETTLLLKGELPKVPSRIAAVLTGGLIKLKKIPEDTALKLCSALAVLCPDDYGCRGIQLELLAAAQQWEEFDQCASQAVERLASEPLRLLGLVRVLNISRQRFMAKYQKELQRASNTAKQIPSGISETLKKMLR